MSAPLRIFHAAGPGDVIGTYRHWKQGAMIPRRSLIHLFLAVLFTLPGAWRPGLRALLLPAVRANFRWPVPDRAPPPARRARRRALSPRTNLVWVANGAFRGALRRGCAIISGGTHWFMTGHAPAGDQSCPYAALRPVAKKCAACKSSGPDRLVPQWPLLPQIGRGMPEPVQRHYRATLHAPAEKQRSRSFRSFRPIAPASFEGIACPCPPPFRVFYAGRIEANKGVFHLLEIAKRFDKEGRQDIEFDLCGEGSALQNLRQQAKDANVSTRFRCHGHVEKAAMRQMYAAAHVVIAPTTTEFVEGFNKTVAEGVLAGRPVITSSVCPALEYVREAVLEVPPDDVKAYADAILRLCDDAALYESKRRGCVTSQPQFYDLGRGWVRPR